MIDKTYMMMLVGGFITFLLSLYHSATKAKTEELKTETDNEKKPLTPQEKNALIAYYCNTIKIDRIDMVDQRLYSYKYYNPQEFIYAVDQQYMYFKYGK